MRRIGKKILLFLTLTILLLELIPNFVFGFNVRATRVGLVGETTANGQRYRR